MGYNIVITPTISPQETPMTVPPRADPRQRAYVLPTRIVWQTEGDAAPINARFLLINNTGQAIVNSPECCSVKNKGQAPGLLLDFGQELNGGIQINIAQTNRNPVSVRVRFGESVAEAMGTPNNDHANHDFVFPLPTYGTQEIGNTGFRFVRLDFVDEGSEAQIVSVRAVTLMRPLEYIGHFECDDARLNEIWRVGARTVHLCLQDGVWDGIKRDRLVWIGDMHPETQVVAAVFGQLEIVPQSLDFVRDTTLLPGWMNGISSYSVWWILIQKDWFWHGGNLAYLQNQRDYLLALLELLRAQITATGEEQMGDWRFLDWPTVGDLPALHAGLHALLLLGLDAGAALCRVLGEDEAALATENAGAELRRHTPTLVPASKQASSLLALSGLYDAAQVNTEALAVDPLSGISSFYGYYVLQARALAGDYDGCLELIRTYWGGMLDLGATSFWEDFDLRWTENAARIDELTPPGKIDVHTSYGDHCYKGLRHSLCHGWAAGPTAWLSEHVLGVQIVQPGCRAVRIVPHLGFLTRVSGTFPTPFGPLHITHVKGKDGTVQTTYEAPEGVQVLVE